MQIKRKFWELMNSAAFEPVMFCSIEGDGDGEGDGEGTGGGDDDAGGDDKGGSDKTNQEGGRVSKLAGGLFGQRKQDKQDDDAKDDGGEDDKAGDGKTKIPQKFLNKDGTPNSDAMARAYSDLEKQFGELKRSKTVGGGEVPETSEGYFADGVKVPEEADKFAGLTTDDPGVKTWADVCKEEGIGKDLATRLMSKMLIKMNDHAPDPIDPALELKALGKGGEQMVEGLFVWVDGMEKAGDLSEDDIDIIEMMMQTAKGARTLAKFRNMSGEKPIPITPGSGARGMSAEQWQHEMMDAVKAKDYKKQAELEELGKTINGEEAGISGPYGGARI